MIVPDDGPEHRFLSVGLAALLRLVDGEYRDFAVGGNGRLTFSEPFGVDLDL